MEHRYSSGEIIQLRDFVRVGNGLNPLIGIVVGIIDNDEYDPSVAAGGWSDDHRGILLNTESAGLVLYSEPWQISEFVKIEQPSTRRFDLESLLLFSTPQDRADIDYLVRRFFAAFTNTGGATPNVEDLAALFIPSGVIVKAVGSETEIYSVQSFIAPRLRILTDGTLTDFREEETEARTEIAGNIAQRLCLYKKSGVMNGERFEARGVKVIQLVRTAEGWRIASVSWDDERDGFSVPAAL